LCRQPVPNDGALDGQWSVLGNRKTAIRRGQHGDAAHLAELQRTLRVRREKYLFDGHNLRLPELQQRRKFGVHLEQPDRRAILLVQTDGPGTQWPQLRVACRVVDLDHTVARELRSAVDPEDPHTYES